MSRRCVFLDRDGVINVKPPHGQYLRKWSDFRLIPGIIDWIRLFRALGYLVIVVTNQRGVARGIMTQSSLDDIHANMARELSAQNAPIDDIFCCPHEEGCCECRKPSPGLVLAAQRKWNIDLAASVMIGDSDRDGVLAECVGMPFVRVEDGKIVSISSDPPLLPTTSNSAMP